MALDNPGQEQEIKRLFQSQDPVVVPPPSKAISEALHTRRVNTSLWQKPIPLYQAALSSMIIATAVLLWTNRRPAPVLPAAVERPVVAPVVRTDTIYIQLPPKATEPVSAKKPNRRKQVPEVEQHTLPPMAGLIPTNNAHATPLGDRTLQNTLVASKDESAWDTIAGFTVQDRQDYFRFIRPVQ